MIASYSARVRWRRTSVSGAMYFIRILEEAPRFRVSFPSAVISDIINTCGRFFFSCIRALLLYHAGGLKRMRWTRRESIKTWIFQGLCPLSLHPPDVQDLEGENYRKGGKTSSKR
jgi:hypothetical protein